MPGSFLTNPAQVVHPADGERELIMMRWGMPPPKFGGPPVTNICNTVSPHWRGMVDRCIVAANRRCLFVRN